MPEPQILIDGDVLLTRTAQLARTQEPVPSGTQVSDVTGSTSEHATAWFMSRLRTGATVLGEHTDIVRAAVRENVDALKKTAADFDEREQSALSTVRGAESLVAATAAATTPEEVAAAHAFQQQDQAAAVPSGSGASGSDAAGSDAAQPASVPADDTRVAVDGGL